MIIDDSETYIYINVFFTDQLSTLAFNGGLSGEMQSFIWKLDTNLKSL
jgi:hypothetical protein